MLIVVPPMKDIRVSFAGHKISFDSKRLLRWLLGIQLEDFFEEMNRTQFFPSLFAL